MNFIDYNPRDIQKEGIIGPQQCIAFFECSNNQIHMLVNKQIFLGIPRDFLDREMKGAQDLLEQFRFLGCQSFVWDQIDTLTQIVE